MATRWQKIRTAVERTITVGLIAVPLGAAAIWLTLHHIPTWYRPSELDALEYPVRQYPNRHLAVWLEVQEINNLLHSPPHLDFLFPNRTRPEELLPPMCAVEVMTSEHQILKNRQLIKEREILKHPRHTKSRNPLWR